MKQFLIVAVLIAIGLIAYRIYTYQPPLKHRIAPAGTLYLSKYVAARTNTGVIGLTPGEMVKLVSGPQPVGKRLITDGVHQFEVGSTYLTDDVDYADQLRVEDAERQKAARAAVEAQKKAVEAFNRKRDVDYAQRLQDDLAHKPAPPPSSSPSP